jgi:hypothetical protein
MDNTWNLEIDWWKKSSEQQNMSSTERIKEKLRTKYTECEHSWIYFLGLFPIVFPTSSCPFQSFNVISTKEIALLSKARRDRMVGRFTTTV